MTVSEQVIQVLDSLCEKFGMAIDWTGANVVPYVTALCMKLVSYEIWTSVAWMVFCTLSIVTGIILIKKYKKELTEDFDSEDFICVMGAICIFVLFATCIIAIGIQIFDIIKCVTFPEMYIFEYIQGVINGGS